VKHPTDPAANSSSSLSASESEAQRSGHATSVSGLFYIDSSETTYGICFAQGERRPLYLPVDEDGVRRTYGVGSANCPPRMSLFPKVAGQLASTSGASKGVAVYSEAR
jgi:hypothetical protein